MGTLFQEARPYIALCLALLTAAQTWLTVKLARAHNIPDSALFRSFVVGAVAVASALALLALSQPAHDVGEESSASARSVPGTEWTIGKVDEKERRIDRVNLDLWDWEHLRLNERTPDEPRSDYTLYLPSPGKRQSGIETLLYQAPTESPNADTKLLSQYGRFADMSDCPYRNGCQSPPTSSSDKVQELFAQLDSTPAFVRKQTYGLPIGQIVFNTPSRMRQGGEDHITVRISRSALKKGIKDSLQGSGAAESQKISIGDVMTVNIVPLGDAFSVVPRSPISQAIGFDTYNQWIFDITALKAKTQTLELQAVVDVMLPNGKTVPTPLEVLDRKVLVDVDPMFPVMHFLETDQNLRWALGGVFGAISAWGGFLFGSRRKAGPTRESDDNSESTDDE